MTRAAALTLLLLSRNRTTRSPVELLSRCPGVGFRLSSARPLSVDRVQELPGHAAASSRCDEHTHPPAPATLWLLPPGIVGGHHCPQAVVAQHPPRSALPSIRLVTTTTGTVAPPSSDGNPTLCPGPACSRSRYAAYQSGQSGSECPISFSCRPCASAARRSALARSLAEPNVSVTTLLLPGTDTIKVASCLVPFVPRDCPLMRIRSSESDLQASRPTRATTGRPCQCPVHTRPCHGVHPAGVSAQPPTGHRCADQN